MMFLPKRYVLATLAASFYLAALSAQATLLQALPEFGDLGRWAAFSLGGGISETDTIDQFTGNTYIQGDVGVAGDGNISLAGNATIDGDLYWRTNGTLSLSGNARITGARHHDAASDSILDNGVNEANSSSAHAATFASSFAYSGLTSITSSMTLSAQHDRAGNSTVLNLTDLVLTSGSILTLQGTASDVYIINVSRSFSLTSQSRIVLSGGIAWNNVLFNVKGSGSDVTLDGQSSLMGILMANARTVRNAGGSIVYGEVIANKIKLSGSAQIIHPPVSSP